MRYSCIHECFIIETLFNGLDPLSYSQFVMHLTLPQAFFFSIFSLSLPLSFSYPFLLSLPLLTDCSTNFPSLSLLLSVAFFLFSFPLSDTLLSRCLSLSFSHYKCLPFSRYLSIPVFFCVYLSLSLPLNSSSLIICRP